MIEQEHKDVEVAFLRCRHERLVCARMGGVILPFSRLIRELRSGADFHLLHGDLILLRGDPVRTVLGRGQKRARGE